jgi:hypothetical protein
MASRKQGGLMGLNKDELLGRIGDLPGAKSVVDGVNTLKERVDDLQKRMRGLDELTRRVEALERRVDRLTGKAAGRKRTTRKSASSGSASARSKPSTEGSRSSST